MTHTERLPVTDTERWKLVQAFMAQQAQMMVANGRVNPNGTDWKMLLEFVLDLERSKRSNDGNP